MKLQDASFIGRDMLETDIPAFIRAERIFAKGAGKSFTKEDEERRIQELRRECQRLEKLRN